MAHNQESPLALAPPGEVQALLSVIFREEVGNVVERCCAFWATLKLPKRSSRIPC